MRDVLLVPRMTSNLIEVSALEDEGYDVIFSVESSFKSSVTVSGLRLVSMMEVYTSYQLGSSKSYYMTLLVQWSYGIGDLLIYIIEHFLP